jgi:rare lipoprotein A
VTIPGIGFVLILCMGDFMKFLSLLLLATIFMGTPAFAETTNNDGDEIDFFPGIDDEAGDDAVVEGDLSDDQDSQSQGSCRTVQSGKATFYADKFVGRPVACQGYPRFSQSGLTAASNTFPCGTKLRVVNRNTGKYVTVTVTDTGGFRAPRVIDLTKKAFRTIGSLDSGVLPVSLQKCD